jgi:hypothetical protein
MNKALAAILAVTATAGVATAQNYVAIESGKNLPAGVNLTTANLGSAVPDLDAAGNYNSTYEYGPFVTAVDDEALDFPNNILASDGKYLTNGGNRDHFFRARASAAIANTENIASVAFAFRIDSLSATAGDNDVDLWRILDIAGTGGAANIMTFQIVDGALLATTNGLGSIPPLVANVSTLTEDAWYVLAARYDRSTASADTFDAWLIALDGTTTQVASATALAAANVNGIAVLATGATLDVPTGTAAIQISLDDFAIYSNALSGTQLLTAVRSDFGLPAPSNVEDWNMY